MVACGEHKWSRHKGDFWKWRKTRCSLCRGCARGRGLQKKVRGVRSLSQSGQGRPGGPFVSQAAGGEFL